MKSLLLWMIACRPDPGAPSYPTYEGLPNYGGPDPYEEGEDRLTLGIFYELDSSENYSIDNASRFFYIWSNSFSVTSVGDRVEGSAADELLIGSLGWWGGGVFWNAPTDFTEWTLLHVSLKASSDDVSNVEVGMGQGDGEVLHWFSATENGFITDGEWHHLSIPLAPAFEAIDGTRIQMPFNIRGDGIENATLLIDNLYLSKGDVP
ncbi:MAG: hypothetical protein VX278_21015 [Myxococcota bacterium]|nr:hypothetical protein [Myxococcota bacterium]